MGAIGSLYVFILIKMEILAMSLQSVQSHHPKSLDPQSDSYSFEYNSKENVH